MLHKDFKLSSNTPGTHPMSLFQGQDLVKSSLISLPNLQILETTARSMLMSNLAVGRKNSKWVQLVRCNVLQRQCGCSRLLRKINPSGKLFKSLRILCKVKCLFSDSFCCSCTLIGSLKVWFVWYIMEYETTLFSIAWYKKFSFFHSVYYVWA